MRKNNIEKNKDEKNKKRNIFSFFRRFRYKYRLSIYRDETYEELINIKLTKLNVLVLVGSFLIVFTAIVASLIIYTPVREFIPGYPDEKTVLIANRNKILLDSLEEEIKKRDKYFENIKKIIRGEEPDNYVNRVDTSKKANMNVENTSKEDSMFRKYVEENYLIAYKSNNLVQNESSDNIALIHFFPPVRGIVTNKFDAAKKHYGIDIVASPDEVVKSILDGTIILTSWTLETGHVVVIQHDFNLISVYKHNAEILKKQGEYVKAGEPIAIIGNSGEYTTGPHLHFELWHKSTPLNPLDYINF